MGPVFSPRDRLGILLEEENKRLREELEAMRRLLLMCVACVRGVREWSRCSPLHPAAPLRVGHDVRHLARSRRDGGLRARPVPLPTAARTANSSTSPSRRRPR